MSKFYDRWWRTLQFFDPTLGMAIVAEDSNNGKSYFHVAAQKETRSPEWPKGTIQNLSVARREAEGLLRQDSTRPVRIRWRTSLSGVFHRRYGGRVQELSPGGPAEWEVQNMDNKLPLVNGTEPSLKEAKATAADVIEKRRAFQPGVARKRRT